ncbi:uncharacterized protein TNIN_345881 [Trichonephila inaurata madagascariensis]|uniref:Ig-like domain-containing protein n=1 Tax=Trichonephila inaurata madagascariensis TaxID=2747483 RepID=A0A8X6WVT1_9ARAC|nr:uncharacterized protein TNIN_345881 [Trichonephila inaurata madagascariensis]
MLPVPLRINAFHVPTPVVTGDSVLLRCAYELGNETLYAVKWYKNEGEFFRYVPAAEPPLKMFPQTGIDVDVSFEFGFESYFYYALLFATI